MDDNEKRTRDELLRGLTADTGGDRNSLAPESITDGGEVGPLLATAMFVLADRRRAAEFAAWLRGEMGIPAEITDLQIIGTVSRAGLATMREVEQYEREECPVHGHGPKAEAKRSEIDKAVTGETGWNPGQYL